LLQNSQNKTEIDPEIEKLPKLVTPKEIALYLKVSPKSVYYWVARNEIPYLRVGRHLRFDLSQVIKWLSEKTLELKPPCFQETPSINRRGQFGL